MLTINKDLYEKAEARDFGEREILKLGGHICVIKNASVYTGMTGNQSLKIEVDIARGDEQEGFFQRQYDINTNDIKKWPAGGTRYVSLKEENYGMLKGFFTCVEKSNPGYKFNEDETKLIGKKIVGVFGLEEFQAQDGDVSVATKCVQFRSTDKLSEVKIPKVKLIDGTHMDYEDYLNRGKNSNSSNNSNVTVSEEDLPFML